MGLYFYVGTFMYLRIRIPYANFVPNPKVVLAGLDSPLLTIFKLQDKRPKRQMLVISELDAYDEALNGELSKAIDQ